MTISKGMLWARSDTPMLLRAWVPFSMPNRSTISSEAPLDTLDSSVNPATH